MSGYEDDNTNSDKPTTVSTWLSVPSPRTLLDRTTKFVLNAAHGKSRSLIPTTDDASSIDNVSFIETSIQTEGDDDAADLMSGDGAASAIFGDEVDGDEYRQRLEEQRRKNSASVGGLTMVVPEADVLSGKWNAFQIVSTADKKDAFGEIVTEDDARNDNRSTTPPGMLRIRRTRDSFDQLMPMRRRTASLQQNRSPDGSRIENVMTGGKNNGISNRATYTGRRTVSFVLLPHRVISRILEFLPIPEMLELLNSCRVVRRVMHRVGPNAYAEGLVGDEAYTTSGMRIWRTMVRRMGWRLWHERIRGREKRQRISVPKSHRNLLKQLCGVENEAEIVEIVSTEPDLLFKAVFDNLYTDYASFRSLEHNVSAIFMQTEDESGNIARTRKRWRSPAELGERLDQLLWFGRGWFAHDAETINKRIVIAADRFEQKYHDQFKRAFISGDCVRMRYYAGILENIREGSGCLRLLVDSHPIFNCGGDLIKSKYHKVVVDSSKVMDSHTFDVFLDGMQDVIEEHACVVAAALPPPGLPVSALYHFVGSLFGDREGRGLAVATLRRLFAYLRSIPVADTSHVLIEMDDSVYGAGRSDKEAVNKTRQAVPDEATKDILYLTTVANVVSLLLVASDKWTRMKPVSIPSELGRRCVYSAFTDVIDDYAQLERRIIERAYGQELDQWAAKVKTRMELAAGSSSFPSSHLTAAASVGGASGVHGGADETVLLAPGPKDSMRLVNFRHRQQQMDEYKGRVLKVLGAKLDISLPPDMVGAGSGDDGTTNTSNNKDSQHGKQALEDTQEQKIIAQKTRRRSSASQSGNGGGIGDIAPPRRTVVGDVLWNAPISIDLCLNMVLTNRDAIDRLAVFTEAPPDMRLRRSAQDAIESVFCILLQSIGRHIRPAFSKVVAELQTLEHTAMVVMVSQGRHTGGAGAAPSSSSGASAGATATSSAGSNTGSGSATTGLVRHGGGGGGSAYSAHRMQAEKELREKFTAVELQFFELIHLSDIAVQMLEIYYKKEMCVFIDESDFLNICNQEKKALEHAVDDSVAVGMDCVIEIILRQTQHILDTEQRPGDYHPDTNVSLALTPTLACARAVQFLGESTTVLRSMTTQKQMREVFLGEIGVRLFNVLIDHIKRFQITEPGGFQLIADLNLYYDWAADNVDPDTLRFFTALKDLANCFILAPRDLRGFLRDQYSRHTFDGVMRMEEIYDVVACRADYRTIRSQVEGHCDFM
ncbi:F-box protein: endocytic membrane traffic, recycling ReCYcling 1 [Coemansia sp. RSA 1939]|nr:F-box protein: endocytic membrane traffic, recycling ReCYcling 1 [Coemansia sp. RSA 1939]KAJ2601631.1 F-box protein: endocytic membrane traffic, recycling ReCYcling 1 [Coemansia sp. RSA 1804]